MNAYIQQTSSPPILGQQPLRCNLSHHNLLLIRREPSKCHLVLDSQYYPEVSRIHLEIRPVNYPSTYNSPTCEIHDLSSNGTFSCKLFICVSETESIHEIPKVLNSIEFFNNLFVQAFTDETLINNLFHK